LVVCGCAAAAVSSSTTMSEFDDFGPGMEIHYVLGSDGRYRMVTKDTSAEVMERFGTIPVVDVIYMYPPIGAQRVNMGRALWEENAQFKQALLACDEISKPLLPQSIIEVMYPDECDQPMYEEVIQTAQFALPCLFAFQYALTEVWNDEFCSPSYVVGHSLGEFMAAVAAGVLDMPTAMTLVCERANLMSSIVSKGSMMAIKGSAEQAAKAIEDASAVGKVTVAAISTPNATTLSGEWAAMSKVLKQLPAGTKTSRVKAPHADHSPLMLPIVDPLKAKVAELYAKQAPEPVKAEVEWFSTVTGKKVDGEAADPEYWARQAMEPVRFVEAMDALLASHMGKVKNMAASEWQPFEKSRCCIGIEMGEGMVYRFGEAIAGGKDQAANMFVEFRSTLSSHDERPAKEVCEDVMAAVEDVMKHKRHERLQKTILAPFLPDPGADTMATEP